MDFYFDVDTALESQQMFTGFVLTRNNIPFAEKTIEKLVKKRKIRLTDEPDSLRSYLKKLFVIVTL